MFSVDYQLSVENPTSGELTLLAQTGEPFLRIGPEGVFGNLNSPTWYDANAPEGLPRLPERAKRLAVRIVPGDRGFGPGEGFLDRPGGVRGRQDRQLRGVRSPAT